MSEWKNFCLGDVCKFIDYRGKTPPKVKSGIPLVTAKIIKNGFIQEPKEFIAEEFYFEWMRRGIPKKGDVVFTTEAPLGEVAQIKTNRKLAFAQRVIIFESDNDVLCSSYLFYALLDTKLKSRIEARQSGTTVSGIKASELKKVEIDLPPLDTQKKIAAVLGALDDKIELNNAINKNLEEQAQAIYNEFYKLADEKKFFSDVVQVLSGGTPKTSNNNFWNGDIPFFTPKDIVSPYVLTTEKFITSDGLKNCNSKLYPMNTTFITARGTVGKITLTGVPMAMNQSCYALVGKKISPILTYFYSLKVIQSLKHKASGSVFDSIVTNDFKSEKINLISEKESRKLLGILEPVMDKILQNALENQKLGEIRDALLPRLMSGEIDVSKVEQ